MFIQKVLYTFWHEALALNPETGSRLYCRPRIKGNAMLTLHAKGCRNLGDNAGQDDALPDDIVWIDLFNPTREEELRCEAQLGVLLPTREDMAEIETSSRLYLEDGAAFMTAQLAYFGGHEHLQSEPVTFVLVGGRLVTIRYIEPASFTHFREHIEKQPVLCQDGVTTFLNLLDVIIDRGADLLEKIGAGIDDLSRQVFTARRETKLEDVLIRLGGLQNDMVRIRDSLVTLSRLTAFATSLDKTTGLIPRRTTPEFHERLRTMVLDLASLSDHASYISGNIAFLLDAALGLISVDQNSVMKVMSVASVIFLPLTLLASIYGMNFVYMPFLHNPNAFWGICMVMVAMIAASLWWFRYKRWL